MKQPAKASRIRPDPMQTVLGYILSGHDNDSFMLGEETRRATSEEERFYDWRFTHLGGQHPATCPKCGRKTDPNYVNPSFRLRRKSMDVSSTYDGYKVVSARFKDFLMEERISGVELVALPSQPGFHWLRAHKVLEVDRQASVGIRFEDYCDMCHQHSGVFGIGGLRFKDVVSTLPRGLYRTDLEFAQAHEQSPLLITDPSLGEAIKARRFKGADLVKLMIG